MYIPRHFEETRLGEQHALIREQPLGLLITSAPGLQATLLPFHLVPTAGPLGTLQSHLSRANPHWNGLNGADALIVFQAENAYISPGWYASKREHGKVVPTWNYVMVQARGTVTVIEDAHWLKTQVTQLTDDHESTRADRWQVSDAPPEFVDQQIKGIVGIEIQIRDLKGKWKVSQNRSSVDRTGVADALDAEGKRQMADLVRRHGRP